MRKMYIKTIIMVLVVMAVVYFGIITNVDIPSDKKLPFIMVYIFACSAIPIGGLKTQSDLSEKEVNFLFILLLQTMF